MSSTPRRPPQHTLPWLALLILLGVAPSASGQIVGVHHAPGASHAEAEWYLEYGDDSRIRRTGDLQRMDVPNGHKMCVQLIEPNTLLYRYSLSATEEVSATPSGYASFLTAIGGLFGGAPLSAALRGGPPDNFAKYLAAVTSLAVTLPNEAATLIAASDAGPPAPLTNFAGVLDSLSRIIRSMDVNAKDAAERRRELESELPRQKLESENRRKELASGIEQRKVESEGELRQLQSQLARASNADQRKKLDSTIAQKQEQRKKSEADDAREKAETEDELNQFKSETDLMVPLSALEEVGVKNLEKLREEYLLARSEAQNPKCVTVKDHPTRLYLSAKSIAADAKPKRAVGDSIYAVSADPRVTDRTSFSVGGFIVPWVSGRKAFESDAQGVVRETKNQPLDPQVAAFLQVRSGVSPFWLAVGAGTGPGKMPSYVLGAVWRPQDIVGAKMDASLGVGMVYQTGTIIGLSDPTQLDKVLPVGKSVDDVVQRSKRVGAGVMLSITGLDIESLIKKP